MAVMVYGVIIIRAYGRSDASGCKVKVDKASVNSAMTNFQRHDGQPAVFETAEVDNNEI